MNPTSQAVVPLALGTLKTNATAEVLHKPGSVVLDHTKYPLLVYAPLQHGAGIRTEDNGTHVADICAALAQTPDYAALAAQFETTVEHVRQAIAYAHECGAFQES